jgi:hypothetical protein
VSETIRIPKQVNVENAFEASQLEKSDLHDAGWMQRLRCLWQLIVMEDVEAGLLSKRATPRRVICTSRLNDRVPSKPQSHPNNRRRHQNTSFVQGNVCAKTFSAISAFGCLYRHGVPLGTCTTYCSRRNYKQYAPCV